MLSALYDQIGNGYDRTRRADTYLTSRLAKHLHLALSSDYLDIACGTGNYTTALAALGGTWVGIDRSQTMLKQAQFKASNVAWNCADVQELPFKSETFDGAICVLAAHHFPSLSKAFSEAFRVVRQGCPFVLFTSTREQMQHYWLAEYFPETMKRSMEQMPDFPSIENSLKAAGFVSQTIEPYHVRDDLEDLFLYCGKNKPELYLDSRVHQAISSFAVLSSPPELQNGLRNLRSDIASGRIAEVQASYHSTDGDYCFVAAVK